LIENGSIVKDIDVDSSIVKPGMEPGVKDGYTSVAISPVRLKLAGIVKARVVIDPIGQFVIVG